MLLLQICHWSVDAGATLCFPSQSLCFVSPRPKRRHFQFLRSGEITVPDQSSYDPSVHLSYNDIAVDNSRWPTTIQVRIKASKTDPFRHGVTVYVGRTDTSLCPVTALLNYLIIRGSTPGPLFHFHNSKPLTKSNFTAKFREYLTLAGVDCTTYSGHSFRIGAASTAAAKGIPDSVIQTLGRWKSSAYLSYVRIAPEKLAALSKQLAPWLTCIASWLICLIAF